MLQFCEIGMGMHFYVSGEAEDDELHLLLRIHPSSGKIELVCEGGVPEVLNERLERVKQLLAKYKDTKVEAFVG